MTLQQQIEEAILSTLVVENKESIKTFCVPRIKEIALELAGRAFEYGKFEAGMVETFEDFKKTL